MTLIYTFRREYMQYVQFYWFSVLLCYLLNHSSVWVLLFAKRSQNKFKMKSCFHRIDVADKLTEYIGKSHWNLLDCCRKYNERCFSLTMNSTGFELYPIYNCFIIYWCDNVTTGRICRDESQFIIEPETNKQGGLLMVHLPIHWLTGYLASCL